MWGRLAFYHMTIFFLLPSWDILPYVSSVIFGHTIRKKKKKKKGRSPRGNSPQPFSYSDRHERIKIEPELCIPRDNWLQKASLLYG